MDGVVHLIDIATGLVTVAPRAASLDFAIPCESFGVRGVLETFGGSDHLVYVTATGEITRISLASGERTVIATFRDAGDTCSFTVDPRRHRFYFHVEQGSQFPPGDERLGSCPASVCSGGACACAAGTESCGGVCVATSRDIEHCGDCDVVCGENEACVDGACVCAGSTSRCGGVCTDQGTDEDHCGDCATACAVNDVCAGECTVAPGFFIESLGSSNCQTISVEAAAGAERGPLGLAGDQWVYAGHAAENVPAAMVKVPTGPFDTVSVVGAAIDFLITDLGTQTLHTFVCDDVPCDAGSARLEALAPVNPATGSVGAAVPLSQPIGVGIFNFDLFMGVGRVALSAPTGLFFIDLATGFVERQAPLLLSPARCDQGTAGGILERSAGEDFVVFVEEGQQRVLRVRLRDGDTTTVLNTSLGSACNLLLDPVAERWAVASPRNTDLIAGNDTRSLISCPASIFGP